MSSDEPALPVNADSPFAIAVGDHVEICWGYCSGRDGVVIAFSATQRGMAVVEYIAKARDKHNGALPGEPVRVYLHKAHLRLLQRSTGKL